MLFIVGIFELALFVFIILTAWKNFEKAGQPGWAIFVPIYNYIVFLKIGGKPWWWIFFVLTGPFFLIWHIWAINMFVKSFGKDEGFTVGCIFLGIVFWPILAFGDARYIGPYGDPVAFKAAQTPDFDFDRPVTA